MSPSAASMMFGGHVVELAANSKPRLCVHRNAESGERWVTPNDAESGRYLTFSSLWRSRYRSESIERTIAFFRRG